MRKTSTEELRRKIGSAYEDKSVNDTNGSMFKDSKVISWVRVAWKAEDMKGETLLHRIYDRRSEG